MRARRGRARLWRGTGVSDRRAGACPCDDRFAWIHRTGRRSLLRSPDLPIPNRWTVREHVVASSHHAHVQREPAADVEHRTSRGSPDLLGVQSELGVQLGESVDRSRAWSCARRHVHGPRPQQFRRRDPRTGRRGAGTLSIGILGSVGLRLSTVSVAGFLDDDERVRGAGRAVTSSLPSFARDERVNPNQRENPRERAKTRESLRARSKVRLTETMKW